MQSNIPQAYLVDVFKGKPQGFQTYVANNQISNVYCRMSPDDQAINTLYRLAEAVQGTNITQVIINLEESQLSDPNDLQRFITSLAGTNVKMLKFKRGMFTPAIASSIGMGLTATPITTLGLVNCQLSAVGAAALTENLVNTNVTDVDFSCNRLGSVGAVAIAQKLKGTKVQRICFRSNNISSDGMTDMAQGINQSAVGYVDLLDNQLGSLGAVRLIQGLKKPGIKALNLRSNQIDCKDAIRLVEAIKVSTIENIALDVIDIEIQDEMLKPLISKFSPAAIVEIIMKAARRSDCKTMENLLQMRDDLIIDIPKLLRNIPRRSDVLDIKYIRMVLTLLKIERLRIPTFEALLSRIDYAFMFVMLSCLESISIKLTQDEWDRLLMAFRKRLTCMWMDRSALKATQLEAIELFELLAANPNNPLLRATSVLQLAIYYRKINLAELLMRLGADLEIKLNGRTAIHSLIFERLRVSKQAIEQSNLEAMYNDMTPLNHAITTGQSGTACNLVAQRANLTMYRSRTPLQQAQYMGDEVVVNAIRRELGPAAPGV